MKKFGKKSLVLLAGAVAAFAFAGSAMATWSIDANGYGFVGKGDVQSVYAGLGIKANDQWLQQQAGNVDFRTTTTSITQTTWTCENDGAPPAQFKSNTTTTTAQGLVTTVDREILKGGKQGKINGFNLSGYDSPPTTLDSSSDGPKPPIYNSDTGMWETQPGTCPANPAGFYLVQSSVVQTDGGSSSALQVTIDSINWYDVPSNPPA
jgi:hypothetical protein